MLHSKAMCASLPPPVHLTGPNYVVGIGASAGGLEALQRFFDAMPPDTGMAFVVIQHLSADYKSMMDELLQRHTRMPVQVVKATTPLAPNHVYLNSSQAHLGLEQGLLVLHEKDPEQRLYFPIDLFFHALGEQYQERSAGVILSGTGTDGSRGVKSIKEHNGLVLVQAPEEAKFDGMPNAIVHLGIADFIQPVEALAAELSRLARLDHPSSETDAAPMPADVLSAILQEVRQGSRIDFSLYRREILLRRLSKRMRVLNQPRLADYLNYLMTHTDEPLRLSQELLSGVTRFFRDEAVWHYLEQELLPALCQSAGPEGLRCWVAGCASGEEAYTLAMLIQDCLDQQQLKLSFKIFATDIDPAAIAFASQGCYPESVFVNVGTERLARYFDKNNDSYQVKKSLRERIVFARHNLLSDPPFLKQDLICCRNVLLHFQESVMQQVLSSLHFALKPPGLLLLGKNEHLGLAGSPLFAPREAQPGLFGRCDRPAAAADSWPSGAAASVESIAPSRAQGSERFFEEMLLNQYVPATLFVGLDGEILYAHGQTHPFIMFPRGRVSYHLDTMLNPPEASLIRSGMQRALRQRETIVYQAVELQREQGVITADITLRAFWHPGHETEVILLEFKAHHAPALAETETITQIAGAGDFAQEHIQALYLELQHKDHALQSLREKLETSHEELQASNEELQASNEEMQSTNEELQSVNEELYTVNAELESKISAMAELNNDLTNFLNSTEIGLIFLDRDFRIRKFTPAICQALNLYESDIGRSVAHFSTRFDQHFDLVSAAAEVLNRGGMHEQALSIGQTQEFLLRILPYRTLENVVQGVVLSLIDVTEINRIRRRANLMNARYQAIFDNIPDYVMLLNARGEILLANQYFQSQLGSGTVHKSLPAAFGGSQDIFLACLQEAERAKGAVALMTQLKSPLSTRYFSHHLCVLPGEDAAETQFILVSRDVSELRAYQEQIQNQASKLQGLIDSSQDLIAALDKDYRLIVSNRAYQDFMRTHFGQHLPEQTDFLNAFQHLNAKQQNVYDLMLQLWERALTGTAFETEAELDLPDGTARHFQLYFAPLITTSGELLGVSHTLRDVSAAHEAEARLHQTLDELERTNAYLDSFVYAAAHDLRAPVANLLSLVDRIKIREPLPTESLFPYLEQSVHSLDHTLNGLIEIIDTQKLSDEKAHRLDVKACFDSIFSDYPQLAPEQVSLQLASEARSFCYLPGYFRSILQNLIDNAVKYQAPERPLQLRIAVRRTAPDTLSLRVQDNGQGLPARLARDKLFKAFQRFHHQQEGKGIGLYLVKTLAEKNGGWVDLLETQEPGTCFILELKEYDCRD